MRSAARAWSRPVEPFIPVGPLSRNRPHVFANDVVVPVLPIAEVSSNDEHAAGVAEAKACLVLEADAEVQRSVIDGMGDEIHDFAVDFGIRLA